MVNSLAAIGAQIRRTRKERKWSAQVLAQRSGIHRNTLLALETGKGNIELSKLLSVCSELGLELLFVPQQVYALRAADDQGVRTELSERLDSLMENAP
ncbi:helix-turn-helix domain-containing protein [Herbaspirillum autotrophicum]|uniref:helix-turn-helix domain-containing protein n=1 Tax=Herbaspirillum autotrophicum TaxID=180195 RepID=UPI000B291C83